MTTEQKAKNWEALSGMIRASAKSTASYVPTSNTSTFSICFPNEKAARSFQDAFESFAHASKRTVRFVEKSLRENRAAKTNLK